MLTLIVIGLFIAILVLPIKHAFGLNLAASFLFIVPNGIDVTTYFFLLLLIKTIIIKSLKNEGFQIDAFVLLFLGLLFFAIVSYLVFQGPNGPEYLRRFIMTISIIFLFLNIYRTFDDLKLLMNYFLAGTLLLSIHLFTQTIIPINPLAEAVFSVREGRLLPRGFANQYVNPNNMGALLVWGFGLFIGFHKLFYFKYVAARSRIKKTKFNVWGVILLINVALLIGMLGSRANLVILVFTALIALFKLSLAKKSMRILIFGSLFVFFISPIILNSLSKIDRLPPTNVFAPLVNRLIHSETETENHEYSRSNLAKNGLLLFLDNPILGVGIGNEANKMKNRFNINKVSHNTYVSLLSELGLIGIFFLLSFIIIWSPYIKNDFVINVLLMIGAYATFHNITLMSLPWLIMAFTKRCYDLAKRTE